MTIRKQYPSRNYDTFDDDGDDSVTQSPTSYQRGGDHDKSRSAAAEAQRLGSQGSWADNFAGGTPATNPTPAASTVDGDEVRDIRYPHLSSDGDPSDPPPVYTPSASTQVGAQSPAAPASPVAARSNLSPVPEPVSAPAAASSSSNPQSFPCTFRDNDEEGVPSSSSEFVRHNHNSRHHHHHHHHHHDDGHQHDEDADSDGLPVFVHQPSRRNRLWFRAAVRGPGRGRGCRGRQQAIRQCDRHKHRARRFKRLCFIFLALIACLWLLIPGLCRSLKNDGRYQLPSFGPRPSHAPWPPPKREHREHETFRSIGGTYQLYDLLDLSTTAGSITVTVEVQPGDKPAVLRLSTSAGSVNVKMVSGGGFFSKPTISDAAKSRTLVTEISTYAGSVSGSLVHGNGGSTSISTNAGSISVTMFAVGVSEMDPPSNISTISNSGSQHIKIVPALSSTEAIRAIEATHTVRGSGSMNIAYPPQWEGMVHLSTHGHGSIDAHGAGLVVRKESSREVYGYKGQTQGRKVEISEIGNGSIKFTC